jgi:AraC-like DNA-binding protein
MNLIMKRKKSGLKFHKQDFEAIRKASILITKDLRWGFTIRELSEKVNLNERKLKYGFKKINGIGIHEFQVQKRMEKAEELLREGQAIKEIYHKVGYKSISSFSQAFKKFYGISPTQWEASH